MKSNIILIGNKAKKPIQKKVNYTTKNNVLKIYFQKEEKKTQGNIKI